MIRLTICNTPIDLVKTGLLLVTTFQDERPLKGCAGLMDWRFNGNLSRLILKSRFSGERGEALLMPSAGRLEGNELMLLGIGEKNKIHDSDIPHLVGMIVDKILQKGNSAFALSISDFISGMFEWRNAVRLLMSMIAGNKEDLQVTLVEDKAFVEDAKARNMDFSYDVQVHYQLN